MINETIRNETVQVGMLNEFFDGSEPWMQVDPTDVATRNEIKANEDYDDDAITYDAEYHSGSIFLSKLPDEQEQIHHGNVLPHDAVENKGNRATMNSNMTLVPENGSINSHEISIPTVILVRDQEKRNVTKARKCSYSSKQKSSLLFGCIVTLTLAITLFEILKNDTIDEITINPQSSDPFTLSLAPSALPFVKPSCSPTSLYHSLLSIITMQSNLNSSLFVDVQSHQRTALDWLVNDMTPMLQNEYDLAYSSVEIVERFTLALLYSATNGAHWYDDINFLSSSHVCDWSTIYWQTYPKGVIKCTPDGRVTELFLYGNSLRGSFPVEIGLLTELTKLSIGNNFMSGSLPSFESLSKLTELYLDTNSFSGSVPNTLQALENLKILRLDNNSFSGKLIDVDKMVKLEHISVDGNNLTGEVPRSFGDLKYLDQLHLQNNDFVGQLDFICEKNDYPLLSSDNMKLDCTGDSPQIQCNCCYWCTFVNDSECDPNTQALIYFNIDAREDATTFSWEVRSTHDLHGPIKAAHYGYHIGESVHLQKCLTFPGDYNVKAKNDFSDTDPFNISTFLITDGLSSISINSSSPLSTDLQSNYSAYIAFSLDSDGLLIKINS